MIILGVILLILGFVFGISILWTIGIVLMKESKRLGRFLFPAPPRLVEEA